MRNWRHDVNLHGSREPVERDHEQNGDPGRIERSAVLKISVDFCRDPVLPMLGLVMGFGVGLVM